MSSLLPIRRSSRKGKGKLTRTTKPPRSPDSFSSSQHSPKELWKFGEEKRPPLPATTTGSKPPIVLSPPARPPPPPPPSTFAAGYFNFSSPSSSSLRLNSKKLPPARPPRPSLSKAHTASAQELDGWAGEGGAGGLGPGGGGSVDLSTSAASSSSRPLSTLPTPFTAFPTPRSSLVRSPVPPLLEISDFGGGGSMDLGWLNEIGESERETSQTLGAGVGTNDTSFKSSPAPPSSIPSSRPKPGPTRTLPKARPPPSRVPPPIPLGRKWSSRRSPPAPIQIFSPLLRSPPKIDISSSENPLEADPNQQSRRIPGRRRSATLQPTSALSYASTASEVGSSNGSYEGSGGSSAGLELEGAVVSRGKLVSMYEVSIRTRSLTAPTMSVKEESSSPGIMRTPGSDHKAGTPARTSLVEVASPRSVYSEDSAAGRAEASLIHLTVTHPSTPSSSDHASSSEGSSTKSRPRLSQLFVPPPSSNLSTLSLSPSSATHAFPPSRTTLAVASSVNTTSLVFHLQSPEQLLSGESSNFTARTANSNQFQFSPATTQNLTPLTDPSSASSRMHTPSTGLSHFASIVCLSPTSHLRSYTPGSGPPTSNAQSPAMATMPGTGASTSSSGKFAHPPRPSVHAYLAASSAGLPRSRSESTPFVETSGGLQPKRLSGKSRWASDSDLRSAFTDEPTSAPSGDDSTFIFPLPRMPAAREDHGRAPSPTLSTKSSFLELPNLASPVRMFYNPLHQPSSSSRPDYAPSTHSSGSGGSHPSSGLSHPPLSHSQSTPMIPTIASIAAAAELPPSINLPLPEAPPLSFKPAPIVFTPISLADARDEFSILEVQAIVSLSLRTATPAGSAHLLSADAMSTLVPLEIRKLQARQGALVAELKTEARRRKRILKYLNEQRGGTSEGKAGRVAKALWDIGVKSDVAAEELFVVTHAIDQLDSALATSSAGGLSLALGKLNASYLRLREQIDAEKKEKAQAQDELAALRAQLDSERAKTLEHEEEKSRLSKELELAKEALLFVEPRTPSSSSSVASHFQHSATQPPLSPDSEPGHVTPDSEEPEDQGSPSSTSDHGSRWSVSTLGAASFFPLPPQRLPDSPAMASFTYPLSPSSFPLSPALPSPLTPRFSHTNTPVSRPSHLHSHLVFPNSSHGTLQVPSPAFPISPLGLHPASSGSDEHGLVYLQAELSPADSMATIRAPTKSSHSHGSSSISMMVIDSPTLPSAMSTFAVVPSYPYSSTYSASTQPLRTSGSRYRRNGVHHRTNSEAGGVTAAAMQPPRRLSDEDWMDEVGEEERNATPKPTSDDQQRKPTRQLSLQKKKIVRAHTDKGPEGGKDKSGMRGKRAAGRKSAMEMETSESIMLALATASVWSSLNGEAGPEI